MARVQVVVDSRVRLPPAGGPGEYQEALKSVRRAFSHENPLEQGPPSIDTWREDDGGLSVPRGRGMLVVPGILARHGVEHELVDRRTWRWPEPGFPPHRRELWAHQPALVDAMASSGDCLIRAGTGAGKTTCVVALAARLRRRTLVMVWNNALRKQWMERAVDELGMDPSDVGLIQGSTFRVAPLTIGMQQTVMNQLSGGYGELRNMFDVVAFDEVQRAPAETAFAAIDPFTARVRVGASADETRHDGLEFLTYDLFGSVVGEVKQQELVGRGYTVDVELRVVRTQFRAPWYRWAQNRKTAFKKLLDEMVVDEGRNALILKLAARAVREGQQVIVFTHRVEHARQLDARLAALGIQSGVLLGGAENAETFDRTRRGLKAGTVRAACGTYQAVGTGIDLPSIARGVAATPIGNNKQLLAQVKGRLCRSAAGKGVAKLAYLLDSDVYGIKPIRNFTQWGHRVFVWHERDWVEGREWLTPVRAASSAP